MFVGVEQRRPLRLAEVRAIGREPREPHWPASARLDRIDLPDVLAEVPKTIHLSEYESGYYPSAPNSPRFEKIVRFATIDLVKAGWLVKSKGRWFITEEGKQAYHKPQKCPACQGKIVKEKDQDVAYRCINSNCPAQLERALLHFASRDALDIEGLGEAVVAHLVKLGKLKSLADIYKLNINDLLQVELFKEKKAQNLLEAIQNSKQQPLARLIFALGIRHVGQKAAYTLAMEFGSMDKLIQAKLSDLDRIAEIGEVMAGAIVDYFHLSQTKKLIRELKTAQVNMRQEIPKIKISELTGKTVVFTGELQEFSRSQAETLVRQFRGTPSSSVSSKTDFLVAGESAGTKFKKAQELGVKIISEKEFSAMIRVATKHSDLPITVAGRIRQ